MEQNETNNSINNLTKVLSAEVLPKTVFMYPNRIQQTIFVLHHLKVEWGLRQFSTS